MKTLAILFFSLAILCPQSSSAQLLGKLKDATMRKIEQRVEDKIVEELSEELARRAMKPVDKAFDDFLRASYQKESGEDMSSEEFDSLMNSTSSAYTDFLVALNTSADIPAEYNFDISLDIETREESKEVMKTEMLFAKGASYIGFKQEDTDEDVIVVMDSEKDLFVMYNRSQGTAQAVPSMFSLSSSFATAYMDEDEAYELKYFDATGKTKKIQGYSCSEFKGETNSQKFTAYFTDDLSIDWTDSFGKMASSMAPQTYNKEYEKAKGVLMKSESQDLETKKKTRWEVKNVSEEPFSLKKDDFKLVGLSE